MIPDSLIICNDILSKEEQAQINHAALIAHAGFDATAEVHRRACGYDIRTLQSGAIPHP